MDFLRLGKEALAEYERNERRGKSPRAVELWSDPEGRLSLVAGDAPAGGEARQGGRIVSIADPAVVREVHDWRRRFDGTIRVIRARVESDG
jgi:hypothetical protein